MTEGLNEDDVIEQWENDVNHRASRFEDMIESITNDISEIEDNAREDMFAIARGRGGKGTKEIQGGKAIGRNEKRGRGGGGGVRGSKVEERESSTANTVAKLPKLGISKFKGTHIDWVKF